MKSIPFCWYILALLIGISTPTTSQGQDLTIIANPQGAPDQLKSQDVKSIFKAQKKWWDNNTKISIALVKSSSPLADIVASKIFEMSVTDVKKYWVQIVFQGKASTPKHFDTEDEIITYIAQTPGSIGVVSANTKTSQVKMIEVDGRLSW